MDPVTGALILGGASGLLGTIGGAISGESEARAAKRARRDLDKGWAQYQTDQEKNLEDLSALIGLYGGDTNAFKNMVTDAYNSGKGQYTAGQFTPEDIQQWLDPNVDYRIQRATTALENSAAGRNQLLSGATQKALQDRSQQIAQEAWDSARTAGLNAFTANESAKQAEAASGANAINNILSMYNSNLSAKTGLEGKMVDIGQNMADQGMNYAGTRANLRTGTNAWSNAFSGGLQGITPWSTAFGTAMAKQ